MLSFPSRRSGLKTLGLALAGLALSAGSGFADTAAPVPNKGDTAWMLTSSALVLMMSIPGLALFYGGLVRTKNMLSVLTQVFAIVAMVGVVWVVYGYSEAFTHGDIANAFFGGGSRLFLRGMDANSTAATFSNGVVIPEYAYMVFQMTFAMITPALIIGAFAERIKFSAMMLFMLLWVTFIYFPIAHIVWYWAGPDAIGDAAKALAAATTDAAKAAAQAKLDAVNADAGIGFQWGALDFAGGTVVHINAGIAGLVGALIIGKRVGYGKESFAPHSLTMSMIGASLLWVGWFGFNAGSNLEAERHDGARLRQHHGRHRRRGAVLAVRRMAGQGQALAARHDFGRGRRPGRRHPGLRLRRPDGFGRARPGGLADLLVLRLDGEEQVRL